MSQRKPPPAVRPRIRPNLHAEAVRQGAVIAGEGVGVMLRGEMFRRLVPLLTGAHTERELLALTAGAISPPELFHALHILKAEGVVTDAAATASEAGAFWSELADAAAPAARFEIVALGETPEARATMTGLAFLLKDALRAEGQDVAAGVSGECGDAAAQPASPAADLTLVVTPHYRAPGMAAFHRQALAVGLRWMPLRLVGERFWLGPVLGPQTACWRCLEQRIRLNFPAETFLGGVRSHDGSSGEGIVARATAPHFPALEQIAVALAAKEAVHALADPERFRNRLLTFDWLARESRWHDVARRPQCPDCGDPDAARTPKPLRIASVPKVEGGHRARTAAETSDAFARLVSPISGVVGWVAPTAKDAHGLIYNAAAGHHFKMGHDSVEWLERSMATRTGGKGGSRAEAMASALGEAVERHSAVFSGEEKTVRASYRSLGADAVDPAHLVHFSEAQYRDRAGWNARQRGSQFHAVPNPFDPEAEIDWVPVWSFSDEAFRLAPASYCFFGHPDSSRHYFFGGDTNGCAAGNTMEEAFVSAFHELVERDGVALWWYPRCLRPGVDIDSFGLSGWKRLKAHYAGLGRDVWALDLTTDLGIPTFAALSGRLGAGEAAEDIIFGFSAHLDPRAALKGALGELNQFLPAVSRREADGSTRYAWPEPDAVDWWRAVRRGDAPYLTPAPGIAARTLEDFEDGATRDLGDDARRLVSVARKAGLDTFALDLTRPDIGMNVVRVIVPGLRHFWRQLGPGRLYDVPVRLGWVRAAVDETVMNPHSIFV